MASSSRSPRRNDFDDDRRNNQHHLAWRRDPQESYSDWKIRVVEQNSSREEGEGEDDTSTTTTQRSSSLRSTLYHVHRVYLASGPRKSDYFKTLFSTQAATMEQEHQTTELLLPGTACDAFEPFLDFLCGIDEDQLTMSSDTAVALHYLADYLQVPPLQTVTANFIQADMVGTNIHTYCREGLKYGVDWVVEKCIQIAAWTPEALLAEESIDEIPLTPILSSSSSFSSSFQVIEENYASSESAARQVMAMLPTDKQVELLRLSLSKSLGELKRFKRVPSLWKENIKDVRASHMPTLVHSTLHSPLQGSGLEFPGRTCPLFYFEQTQSPQERDDGDNVAIALFAGAI